MIATSHAPEPPMSNPLRLAPVLLALLLLGAPARAHAQVDELEARVERAMALHQSGDVLGAIEAYQAILARAPDRADVRSNLGAAYARLGRYSEAIEQYRQALAQIDSPAIRFNLGLALKKTARIAEAAPELAKVVEQQPENANAVLLLAECSLELEENRKVVDLLAPREKTLSGNPAYAYLLGTALVREGETERGQAWLDRVLSAGDSAQARVLMGAARLKAGDFAAAAADLKQAAALDPSLPTVNSLLGQALQRTGDAAGAAEAYRKELALNPNDFDANLQLGNLRREDGRLDDALAYLTRAGRLREGDPNVLYSLGSLYFARGEHAKACESLEALVKQAPEFSAGHVLLAQVYFRLERKDDAAREQAIAIRLAAQQRDAVQKREP
jgi:tetratricopeptide (TPR) repeat protein